jgi:AmmeMemoRadiSam system protein A
MQPAVVFAGVSPHPPIIIPEIGGRRLAEAAATVSGVAEMARRLVASCPDTVLIISPHAPLDARSFGAYSGPRLRGDFWDFDAAEVEFDLPNDIVLLSRIAAVGNERSVPMWLVPAGRKLDHGTMVPLYYLVKAGWKSRVVVVGLSLLPAKEMIRFGECIRAAAEQLGIRLAICASGDMSHRLTPGAPAGYSRQAHLYDEEIVEAIKTGAFERVIEVDPDLREEAAEDIYRSLLIAYGAIGQTLHHHEVCSYEGPFGVGYMAAVLADYGERGSEGANISSTPMPPSPSALLPALARRSVEFYLREQQFLPTPEGVEGKLAERAAVFVSIKTREGELRGCVGTVEPVQENVAKEVIHAAVSAATQDSRFDPVRPDELDGLVFSVDVLSEPEVVKTTDALDAKRYGVIVESEDGRRGLLLPDLAGIETVEEQVGVALRKAGIKPGTPVTYHRFTVERFREQR